MSQSKNWFSLSIVGIYEFINDTELWLKALINLKQGGGGHVYKICTYFYDCPNHLTCFNVDSKYIKTQKLPGYSIHLTKRILWN